MVGILVSFWDGLFSGAMLVSGRVCLFSGFNGKAGWSLSTRQFHRNHFMTRHCSTRVIMAWSASIGFLVEWTNEPICQWIIRVIGGRDYIYIYISPLEGNVYLVFKMYISGMYCQLGDYILPTTLYKNLKNPLNLESDPLPPKMDEFEVYVQRGSPKFGHKTPQRIGIWVWWK